MKVIALARLDQDRWRGGVCIAHHEPTWCQTLQRCAERLGIVGVSPARGDQDPDQALHGCAAAAAE